MSDERGRLHRRVLSFSGRVFHKARHRVTVKGKVQGCFDAKELAQAVNEVVKQQDLQADALLGDAPDGRLFVRATSKETSGTVCQTSYRTPRGNGDLRVTIWEARQATSSYSIRSSWGGLARNMRMERQVRTNPVRAGEQGGDDVLHIGQTLVAVATTADRFRRERPLLDRTGQYYRFKVLRCLEYIGLEETKKVKETARATRRHISSQEAHKQMQACAGSIASRECQ
ncbi:hypothetical protein EK21DRAFT_119331 [Setomelanomma holmii]|uniref:Uncharacterized protein n=1 Tax=Setomelanomma holmii TaxID=210430 RepID=A0A9P4LF75_9PLEO|nr:hypothetical protein EK21DRAFT_119331 [Setomelanomma holmii]